MQAKFTAAAIAILAFSAATPALAQTDDVIVDGRIITGENPAAAGTSYPGFVGGIRVATGDVDGAPAGGGSRHTGGVNVLMGDGSVRSSVGGNKTESIGIAKTETAKPARLGSLNNVGSIGQLATPPGTPPTQAANNLKQLGLASHNYDSSAGGDVNGDGIGDIIVGTGGSGAHVKSGAAGGAPHVKAFGAGRDAGPKTGGATHVKVFDGARAAAPKAGAATQVKTFDGNARAVGVGGAAATFTLDKQGKSTK